jgi:hypothetical protein
MSKLYIKRNQEGFITGTVRETDTPEGGSWWMTIVGIGLMLLIGGRYLL